MFNNGNNKWEFFFMQRERQNSGGENLIKSFGDKAEAIKYYYLFQLHSYFFNHYVHPFKFNNKDINMGRPSFNLEDRKSTRLNSSHVAISYAVFCLKNKKRSQPHT